MIIGDDLILFSQNDYSSHMGGVAITILMSKN